MVVVNVLENLYYLHETEDLKYSNIYSLELYRSTEGIEKIWRSASSTLHLENFELAAKFHIKYQSPKKNVHKNLTACTQHDIKKSKAKIYLDIQYSNRVT